MPVIRNPRTTSELKRDLLAARARDSRWVFVRATRNHTTGPIEVVGPDPSTGRSLTITLLSGIPRLRVTGGVVRIIAQSSWGNSIDVAPGAAEHVTVHVPFADIKVTTHGLPCAALSGDLSRTFWDDKYARLALATADQS